MIETNPTIDQVVITARDRTLRLLARVARRQGEGYEMPSFVIARTLYGPEVINMLTWSERYGGRQFTNEASNLAYYSARGYSDAVTWADLEREHRDARDVSRETPLVPVADPPAVQVADSRGGALFGCTCGDCTDMRARVDNAPERECQCEGCDDETCPGGCESCESHSCEQCYGADYQCDDHDCDDCYSGHSACDGCGYCSECGSHEGERDEDRVCPNCAYCHECEHVCDHY